MKRLTAIILAFLICAIGTSAGAEGNIPQGAQDFADKFFFEIVADELHAEHSSTFNLNPDSENITFGPLIEQYHITKEFIFEKKPDLSKGIVPSNEYLAVVYQDGKPVNVIGTYKNEAGLYELSTFGFDFELAQKMDKFKGGEIMLYEGHVDAWYTFNGKKLKPLNDNAKQLMKAEKTVGEYQKIVHERYKDIDNNPEMGGGYSQPEGKEDNDNIFLYSIIGVLGITSLGLFFRNRKLKNNQM